MSENKPGRLTLKNVQLYFRNFQGREGEYNEEGNRNFGVFIDDLELAERLREDGWNIKYKLPREDDPDGHDRAWLKVKVKYGDYPPTAYMITPKGKKRLDEELIEQLDWSRIEKCDLIINPYPYPARKNRPAGISAYLKTIHAYVITDEFEDAIADIPDLD